MTMSRGPMGEKEKAYLFCLLFVPLWPLALAMAMVDLCEAIGRGFKALWRVMRRKRPAA